MANTGPWNLILSNEGKDSKRWIEPTVKKYIDNGYMKWDLDAKELHWNPRFVKKGNKYERVEGNPSGTIWRHIPPQDLSKGVTVKFQFYSRKAIEQKDVKYDDKWSEKEDVANLRRVAGTGDFRIALMQTNDETDSGLWHAYQCRIYPYLHKDAKHHIGESDTSNNSYWYRSTPGPKGTFTDDWSQESHRFVKLNHKGELKFGFGPHSPYDQWVDVELNLTKDRKGMMKSSLRVHDQTIDLDPYEHKTKGFKTPFDKIDAYSIGFNNMRPYYDLRIKDEYA